MNDTDANTLADLLADLAYRRYLFATLMTQMIREKAALQVANDRLREELRRYTSGMVGAAPPADVDSTPVPPPPAGLDKRARARLVMQQRADDEVFIE